VADRVAAFDNDGPLACEKPHTALERPRLAGRR
jgi:hypothetical protein